MKTLEEVKSCLRLLSEAEDEQLQASADGELTECLASLCGESEFKAIPPGQRYPVAQLEVMAAHDHIENAIARLHHPDCKQAKKEIHAACLALVGTKSRQPSA